MPARTADGRRGRFALECWKAALSRTHFIYGHPGIARAHWRGPFLRRPCAVWLLGSDAWGPRMRGDYGRVVRAAEQVLAISEFTRRRAAEVLPQAGQAAVCWLGTEEDEPPERPPDFQGPPTVLILSRIDRSEMRKGHRELIDAWPAVVAAVPAARLLIAGGGDGLPLLQSQAAASSAAGSIEFTGFVPQGGIAALWRRAHVFAMPSRQEGFGLVYVEAMRQGLPVIASVHDAGCEVNVHGETGYNVDLEGGDLGEPLIALLRDQDLARRLGQAGQARWRAHFGRSAFRRRLRPILDGFLGRGER